MLFINRTVVFIIVFLELKCLSFADQLQNNTSNSTDEAQYKKKDMLSENQEDGVITIEFKSDTGLSENDIHALKQSIVDKLNFKRFYATTTHEVVTVTDEYKVATELNTRVTNQESSPPSIKPSSTTEFIINTLNPDGARRKREVNNENGDYYTVEDVYLVEVEPNDEVYKQHVTLYVEKHNKIYPGDKLREAADEIRNSLTRANGDSLNVIRVYKGFPSHAAKLSASMNVWLPIVVFLILIIIIIILLCCCCRKRKASRESLVPVRSEPIQDEEAITKGHAPASNTAHLSENGHKKRNIDDSWGCIIPYDQLTEQERTSC